MTHRLAELLEEEFRLKQLRRIVDQMDADLRWNRVPDAEVNGRILETRRRVLELFPDGGTLFDLVCRKRFERTIRERQDLNIDRKDKDNIHTDCVGL